MPGKLTVYNLGEAGVDVDSSPVHIKDGALRKAQNAIFDDAGEQGSLVKRPGHDKLNSAALSGGSALAVVNVPLALNGAQATTRTLYAGLDTGDLVSLIYWLSTVNGFVATTNVTTMIRTVDHDDLPLFAGANDEIGRRHRVGNVGNKFYYPGGDYTLLAAYPPITMFDGTNNRAVATVPPNAIAVAYLLGLPSTDLSVYGITNILAVGTALYFCTYDRGLGTAPNYQGRVLALDLVTGHIQQIGEGFGSGTAELQGGGCPYALCYANGSLWVGTYGGTAAGAGASIAKVYRIRPGVDTTWTLELTGAAGTAVMDLIGFRGEIFAALAQSDGVATASTVRKRATDGTWSTSRTNAATGARNCHNCLVEQGGSLYVCEWGGGASGGTIVKKYDNTSAWATEYTVSVNTLFPKAAYNFNGEQFVVVGNSATPAGRILRRTSGAVWSETGNLGTATKGLSGAIGMIEA